MKPQDQGTFQKWAISNSQAVRGPRTATNSLRFEVRVERTNFSGTARRRAMDEFEMDANNPEKTARVVDPRNCSYQTRERLKKTNPPPIFPSIVSRGHYIRPGPPRSQTSTLGEHRPYTTVAAGGAADFSTGQARPPHMAVNSGNWSLSYLEGAMPATRW